MPPVLVCGRRLFLAGLLGLLCCAAPGWTQNAPGNAPSNDPAVAAEGSPSRVRDAAGSARHLLTFGLDRVGWLQAEVAGQPLWKFVASLIFILLAFYSSKFLDWLVTGRLRKWAARTETKFDDVLLDVMHGPVKVVCFVIFLHVGLQLFEWQPWVQVYLSKGLRLVVAWSLTYMTVKAVHILIAFWKHRVGATGDRVLDDQLFPLLRKVVTGAIILVAILLTCDNLGVKITSVLAGLSIGGLALGLAAQDTVANLFGAVAIFMDRPFLVGDRIKLDTVDGTVEAVGLRSIQVRNLDGHLVTIPNKTVGNATITNVSRRPNIKTTMTIGLTYETTPAKIREATAILNEIYQSHPKTADLVIGFDKFADSSLNLSIIHWWAGTDYKEYVAAMHELNLQVKERFDAAGLVCAFPSQTVYLRQDSRWRMENSPE